MRNLDKITKRVKAEAKYVILTGATVRKTSEEFGVSKTTVHLDLTKRLSEIDIAKYYEVRKVLNNNMAERAIRGGLANQKKYKK